MSELAEIERRKQAQNQNIPWKKWGPYLSERQWGTVREDYSNNGDAWSYFTHDQARSRAYHWGEDGLAGISDEKQRLCFSMALWNGKDPILKERLFGLNNTEGNHGEDVKEYYFYLDSTPTHSYMKYLYKYPHSPFPYSDLVSTNQKRTRTELEYELLDTGIFDDNRYFDVFVEYAKETPEDILIKVSLCNRGSQPATIHLLPTLWFRNTWNWWEHLPKPILKEVPGYQGISVISAYHADLGEHFLYCEGNVPLLFTENDTNNERIFNQPNRTPYVKDGINNYIVNNSHGAVNPEKKGTKASPHYLMTVDAGMTTTLRLRLSNLPPDARKNFFGDQFEQVFKDRIAEADQFYNYVTPPSVTEQGAKIMRQALAGMLWSKQYYFIEVDKWLQEHHADPFDVHSYSSRNKEWFHMINNHIISMPDKWEYPWYAAWDLAFHTLPLAIVDEDFAKEQILLMLSQVYLHPSGQMPAYEWNFSDVNPPVHAWSTFFLYKTGELAHGKRDIDFLKRAFSKLALNFTWWVNRKDRFNKNVFEGGFLGLDNIGVFDRSMPLPTGGYLEQADGTAWMAFFCQNMIELSIELSIEDTSYQDMALKFAEHFLWIASAINKDGDEGMWDEGDGFYYDLLRLPDGSSKRLKVRSIVGLLPICATTVIESWQRESVSEVAATLQSRLQRNPEILKRIHLTGKDHLGVSDRGILALVNEERLRKILTKMLDENEFLSPYGIRSISRYHLEHPFIFKLGEEKFQVEYLPAESNTGMFGGNSNWRGPIWMPINVIIIRALLQYYLYYGDKFKIECPTGSGKMMNLFEVSKEIANRLTNIFLPDPNHRRPVFGGSEKFQNDPFWRDNLLFYEYFHGDNGAGLGASHQTGWTGLIAKIIELYGNIDPQKLLMSGKRGFAHKN